MRHLGSRIFLVWLAKLFETGIHFWLVNVWPEHQKFSWIRAAGNYKDLKTRFQHFLPYKLPLFKWGEGYLSHQPMLVPTNFIEIPGSLEWITRAASAQVLNRQSVDGGQHIDLKSKRKSENSKDIFPTTTILLSKFSPLMCKKGNYLSCKI